MPTPETQLSSPAWVHAWQRVLAIVPRASTCIRSPYYLTPDPIWEAARGSMLTSDFTRIPNVESLHDVEVFDSMFTSDPMPDGNVIFIPDDCFRKATDPYTVNARKLRRLVEQFPTCVFDGDVLFISEDYARISMFHHEGGHLHIRAAL